MNHATRLKNFSAEIRSQVDQAAKRLFPSHPAGYVEATKLLATFAMNAASARVARLQGDIPLAMVYESSAQRAYDRMPPYAKDIAEAIEGDDVPKLSRANPKKKTAKFSDLAIGDTFEFDNTGVPFSRDLASGPWVKVRPRSYVHAYKTPKYRHAIGSTSVPVVKLSRANPRKKTAKQMPKSKKTARKNPRGEFPKATRYIGDLKVVIETYDPPGRHDGRWYYRGSVQTSTGKKWAFDTLGSGVGGYRGAPGSDSALAYDHAAQAAASFASYYTTGNRGDDLPSWAPSAGLANQIEADTSSAYGEDGGHYVQRKRGGRRSGPYGR